MPSLIERAKQDARDREKEKREQRELVRKKHNEEIQQLRAMAAQFVANKLDTEVSVEDLQTVTGARRRGYYYCWHLTIDGVKLEVTRNTGDRQYMLWRAAETSAGEPRRIKRLADLVEPNDGE